MKLSIHLPYGEDLFMHYMSDEKRAEYTKACESLQKGRDQRELILSTTPTKRDTKIENYEIKRRYDEAGKLCDAALDVIWALRAEILRKLGQEPREIMDPPRPLEGRQGALDIAGRS